MRDNEFEKALRSTLEHFDQAPPDKVWTGISKNLGFSWIFPVFGLSVLLLTAFLSISFLNRSTHLEVEKPVEIDKIILEIYQSQNEAGEITCDTIYQELPKFKNRNHKKSLFPTIAQVNPLPANVDTIRYRQGAQLFRNYCAVCHVKEQDIDLTGPSLYGVTKKYEKEWLYEFTRNSQEMIAAGDARAVEAWESWDPLVMNNFKNLLDGQLDDLYYYIEQWPTIETITD